MTDNPFRSALERRTAEKRAALSSITVEDMADVVRQMAIALAAGDQATVDRLNALPPPVRAIVAAEAEKIEADNQAALLKRRAYAGVATEAVDERKAAPPADAPQAMATGLDDSPSRLKYRTMPRMFADQRDWIPDGSGDGTSWMEK